MLRLIALLNIIFREVGMPGRFNQQSDVMTEQMINVSNRMNGDLDRYGSDEAIWWLHHELRGSLNALGLCIRVLESGSPDREAREYAKFISEASEKIERLVAKLRPTRVQ